ncbi:uncharacterized protein LOC110919823 [Helianthus annuus]|uniref:uncharacterized protein LOC110919823 n=1 Tax=Helianthus annuus TaxID=4232 RepID=UPI000B8FBC92|nr:uncharacterized protein LOC110919823 [Helianthus annuus]
MVATEELQLSHHTDERSYFKESSSALEREDSTFRWHYGGNGAVRRRNCRDRGMSPVRNSDTGGDEEELNASTESWRNTMRWTPARCGGGGSGGHARQLSGLAFCLSPLVRASPNRPEVVFSGEIRVPVVAGDWKRDEGVYVCM